MRLFLSASELVSRLTNSLRTNWRMDFSEIWRLLTTLFDYILGWYAPNGARGGVLHPFSRDIKHQLCQYILLCRPMWNFWTSLFNLQARG